MSKFATIYSIASDGGTSYFPTLKEAREAAKDYFEWYEIERLDVVALPPRELACRLLNAESFVVARETVHEQTGGVRFPATTDDPDIHRGLEVGEIRHG
jgi:hypothetical protein